MNDEYHMYRNNIKEGCIGSYVHHRERRRTLSSLKPEFHVERREGPIGDQISPLPSPSLSISLLSRINQLSLWFLLFTVRNLSEEQKFNPSCQRRTIRPLTIDRLPRHNEYTNSENESKDTENNKKKIYHFYNHLNYAQRLRLTHWIKYRIK